MDDKRDGIIATNHSRRSRNAKTCYRAKALADMAGVSVRTLYHYENIGLLHPKRDENNWRRYEDDDVARLRTILTLRVCGLPLSEVRMILADPEADLVKVLTFHRQRLKNQMNDLSVSLETTEEIIEKWKKMKNMSDSESFELLKKHSIESFEEEYGQEARERYGDDVIDGANERFSNMTQDEWDAKEELEQAIKDELKTLTSTGDYKSEDAARLADMHARWLQFHWPKGTYTPDAHRGLAQGYLQDERFVNYYDSACGTGATEFLVKVIEQNIRSSSER